MEKDILISRAIGIIAIASGFILGINVLDNPGSIWLPISLGLILLGLCAQGYFLFRTIIKKIQTQDKNDL